MRWIDDLYTLLLFILVIMSVNYPFVNLSIIVVQLKNRSQGYMKSMSNRLRV